MPVVLGGGGGLVQIQISPPPPSGFHTGVKVDSQYAKGVLAVLGCLAMIDEGETDWKIIAIDASRPRHCKVAQVATPFLRSRFGVK